VKFPQAICKKLCLQTLTYITHKHTDSPKQNTFVG